jgi:hypothetical protein
LIRQDPRDRGRLQADREEAASKTHNAAAGNADKVEEGEEEPEVGAAVAAASDGRAGIPLILHLIMKGRSNGLHKKYRGGNSGSRDE